ncbi:unnamed protein product [Menidia menidia]|uniref:(Atlantic silverside) hypothetical protein n=1 Tax=Menidia menidia TaxID=238744 RepID=A0A8S4AE97_9TELE|nr:unnamed protein product [Menidia menidia]
MLEVIGDMAAPLAEISAPGKACRGKKALLGTGRPQARLSNGGPERQRMTRMCYYVSHHPVSFVKVVHAFSDLFALVGGSWPSDFIPDRSGD